MYVYSWISTESKEGQKKHWMYALHVLSIVLYTHLEVWYFVIDSVEQLYVRDIPFFK